MPAVPALAGPPYITDDPEPVDYQHWEVYLFTGGAQSAGDTTGLVGDPITTGIGTSDGEYFPTPGWDYVTGYGVPQGYPFIQAAAAHK